MHVAPPGAASQLAPMHKASEKSEGPGPDHDGDSDNSAVSAAVKSQPPAGTGTLVDVKA